MSEHDRPPGHMGRRTSAARDIRAKPGAGVSHKRRSNAVKVKPPPPATQRGRETRKRLMEALTALLQERAFHEIRLEDITHEAGVRVSLFYHYFQSKVDITHEVLSDLLESFRAQVAERPKDDSPLSAIHFANQQMVALYASNPGAMRCLVEVHDGMAPFARMWRQLTLEWNERIAASIRRQFPDAFVDGATYLSLAYALAGTADNFLFEYYVIKNEALRAAHPTPEDVARFLTILWFRALYLENPPVDLLGRLPGFRKLGPQS